jgi:non-ribosomal peptide synthetase component F
MSSVTMVYAFDTLGYARRLRDAGVPQDQAEAHATAARDFVMAELVTKTDLNQALALTRAELSQTLALTRAELNQTVNQAVALLDQKIALLDQKIDAQTLRLTVRLGVLMAAGIAILGAIIKLA